MCGGLVKELNFKVIYLGFPVIGSSSIFKVGGELKKKQKISQLLVKGFGKQNAE